MAIVLTSIHGKVVTDVAEFIIDTPDDIANLPTLTEAKSGYEEVPFGSRVLVISTGDVYVLNSSGVWTII